MSELNNRILAVARLPLRRSSTWRVLLVLIAHTSPATLTVAEIANITGISQRSVKSALQNLRRLNLVRRIGRILVVQPLAVSPAHTESFSVHQERAIRKLLRRASKIVGTPEDTIEFPAKDVIMLGLTPPMTVVAAHAALQSGSTARCRRQFVGALVALVNSEQVRGHAI